MRSPSRLLHQLSRFHKHYSTSPSPLSHHHTMSTTTPTTETTTSPNTTSPIKPIGPATTRVGWIGTGVMGRSMVTHILNAGYTVTLYNRTLSKAQPILSSFPTTAHLAQSPSHLASQSDVVFTILGFPSDVISVTSSLLPSLPPSSIYVDMTSSDPTLATSLSHSHPHCHVIDAPVSGGDLGARSASLSIFAGGDHNVVRSLSPLLDLMGTTHYMGGPGKGQLTKMANQVTIASTMVGLVEGLVFAHRAGLEVERFVKAIATGAAGSRSLELYGGRMLRRDFEAGFYVDHFVKDLGICLKECERMGLALPGLALASQLYLSLKAHGEGRLGTQALLLALERLNNVSLGGSGS